MAGCNVEKAHTFKDVYTHVFPMVTYLGPYAHCDPVLIIKLIRIGKTYMKLVRSLNSMGTHISPDKCIQKMFFLFLDKNIGCGYSSELTARHF